MSEETLEYEKITTTELLKEAVRISEKKGQLSEKALAKGAKVSLSSAAKAVAALRLVGVLGEGGKHGYAFVEAAEFSATDTRLILEKIKDGESYGQDFLYQLLLPSLKTAVNWGNIGVAMLERKLGLGYYRAADLFGLLDAAGIIGGVTEINPGRRDLAITPSEFDAIAARLGERK